jgi:spermidine/putrescine transport system substrate-binding protein/spermidine/putrescine transport system permease protein
MKKFLISVLALVLVLGLVGCSKGGNEGGKEFDPIAEFGSNELYVFNWGEYIDEDNITKFEDRYNVTVYYKTFDSNEEMYTAVVGGDKYDIIVPSDYMVERLIKEGLIQKLDLSLITDIDAIADGLKSPDYDPKHEYSIPYFQGSVGIVYDTTKVSKEEIEAKGWDILIDPKYAGEVCMYNADRDNFLPALKALGYSVNTNNDEEIQKAYNWLLEQKKNVGPAYVTDEVNDIMINGEKTLAVAYSGAAAYIMMENPDMGYCEPYQGTNVWSDAMCIPSTSTNTKLAHAWINFCMEEEVAAANSLYVGYTPSIQSVLDDLSTKDFEGINAYLPRVGYDKDEEYHDDNVLKTKLGELWNQVMFN